MFGFGFTTLMISHEEMNNIKIVESLEEFVLLVKGVRETIKMIQNNKWRVF